ncbi:DUF423 domain-containing protein [Apibacter muscae]|uniref:DUF423 domain-containing protein n=1 Tax=Apibacter muscae TaxID=2509004 RepID=A0A563DGI1_9FLAO|nr:DUF423 domain-containing protein [Apibacter muscae]TWP24905.1 DUF423 domain-containing protein [Apibacter muscae]TWP29305.1 DUF423 domain-containing protein [Apibacter muscae]TWP31119.1 DUF423 domain-containing protein [Apibacter muscae]
MKSVTLIFGTLYGLTSVILGAFGAHAFKKILSPDKLESFETGVKYQMYHALALLIIGLSLSFSTSLEKWGAWGLIIGTFLFSFSIYFLSFSDFWKMNLKFLGPITPLGGFFMILGWACLLLYFIKCR